MASITSVISFFILLLATYSYSAPVAYEYENSTPQFEFTTGTTIVEHVTSVNMQLVSDDESTVVPNIGKNQPSVDFNSEEATTSDVHHSLRSFEESSSPSGESNEKRNADESNEKRNADESNEKRNADESNEKRNADESNEKRNADESNEKRNADESNEKRNADESNEKRNADESNEKRGLRKFMDTTIETSTDFNRRAIRPAESQEEIETSTPFHSANHVKFTTDFEPSSSVDSFAKSTGLLHDDQTDEHTSTSEYQHHDQSNEESTTRFPVKTQKFVKTVSIIPGKVTETIYTNAPKETLTETIYTNAPQETVTVKKPVEKIRQ